MGKIFLVFIFFLTVYLSGNNNPGVEQWGHEGMRGRDILSLSFGPVDQIPDNLNSNPGPGELVLNQALWINANLPTSRPMELLLDYRQIPVARRRLGSVAHIRSLSISLDAAQVLEREMNPAVRERADLWGLDDSETLDYDSDLGSLTIVIEDEEGYQVEMNFGTVLTGSRRTYVSENPNFRLDVGRFPQQSSRNWYLSRIIFSGIRPLWVPEEINIYRLELMGN